MHKLAQKYADIISHGVVSKAFVRGMSRALNSNARREHGYSTGETAPKLSAAECSTLLALTCRDMPRVDDKLTAQGLAWLRSRRVYKHLGLREKAIVDRFTHYTLVDWYDAGRGVPYYLPVWRVHGDGGQFDYYTGSWQSGVPLSVIG